MTDYDELRKRAELASRGPWKADTIENVGENWLIGSLMLRTGADDYSDWIVTTDRIAASAMTRGGAKEDAEYIAEVYPDVVLALLDEREELLGLLREARELMDIHVPSEHGGDQVMCAIDDALKENSDG